MLVGAAGEGGISWGEEKQMVEVRAGQAYSVPVVTISYTCKWLLNGI